MLAASLVLAAPAVTFTSCGDDDPEEIPGGGGGDDADDVLPNEPSAQNPLTSHEQKQKLEAIAKGCPQVTLMAWQTCQAISTIIMWIMTVLIIAL